MRAFAYLSFSLLCLLYSIQITSQQICEDDCRIQYLTQPVQDLTCNPYSELYNQLRLGCSASGPIGVQTHIFWYRVLNASNDVTPELLSNDTEGVIIYPKLLNGRSPTTDSVLLLTNVHADDAGKYWCQVSVNGSTFQLLPSQETIIASPEAYISYPPCPRHLFTPTVSCADNTNTSIIFGSDSHGLNTPLASNIYTCNLLFLNQPPSHLPCNPYEDEYNQLRLECNVQGPSDAVYHIEWYRQLELAAPQVLTHDLARIQVYTTSYETGVLRSRFTLFGVDEEDVGTYWCQVSARNGSHTFANQMRSQSVFLDRWKSYNSCAVCPDVYLFSPKLQCADTLLPTTPWPMPSPSQATSGTVFTPVNESHSLSYWVRVSISIVAVTITVLGLLLILVSVYKIRKHCAHNRIKGDVTNDGRSDSLLSSPSYCNSYPLNIPTAQSGHEMASPDSYQALSSHTKDYTTIYTEPTRIPNSNIELNGHLYSLLDATTREPTHTYMAFEQDMP